MIQTASIVVLVCGVLVEILTLRERYLYGQSVVTSQLGILAFLGLMFLVYPLLGHLADVCLNRYRTIKCSFALVISGKTAALTCAIIIVIIMGTPSWNLSISPYIQVIIPGIGVLVSIIGVPLTLLWCRDNYWEMLMIAHVKAAVFPLMTRAKEHLMVRYLFRHTSARWPNSGYTRNIKPRKANMPSCEVTTDCPYKYLSRKVRISTRTPQTKTTMEAVWIIIWTLSGCSLQSHYSWNHKKLKCSLLWSCRQW